MILTVLRTGNFNKLYFKNLVLFPARRAVKKLCAEANPPSKIKGAGGVDVSR